MRAVMLVKNLKNRLLFVHLLNDYSGSSNVLLSIVNMLGATFDVAVMTSENTKGFLDNVKCKKYTINYRHSNCRLITLWNYIRSQFVIAMKVVLLSRQYDIVYVNTLLPFGAAIAARLAGLKVVYHLHETYISPRSLFLFLRSIVRMTAAKAICVSKYTENVLSLCSATTVVMYNQVSQDILQHATMDAHRVRGDGNEFKVLMVCSPRDYKGIPEFLKIAATLNDYKDITFQLVLNGSQEELDEYFKDKVLSNNVYIYPMTENIYKYYLDTDLVLNLTRTQECVETFGMTILEAMSFGIPVIAPPVGGPTELVVDAFNGYMIDSIMIEQIADRIIYLRTNNGVYTCLSENAAATARKYNDADIYEHMCSLLSSLTVES